MVRRRTKRAGRTLQEVKTGPFAGGYFRTPGTASPWTDLSVCGEALELVGTTNRPRRYAAVNANRAPANDPRSHDTTQPTRACYFHHTPVLDQTGVRPADADPACPADTNFPPRRNAAVVANSARAGRASQSYPPPIGLPTPSLRSLRCCTSLPHHHGRTRDAVAAHRLHVPVHRPPVRGVAVARRPAHRADLHAVHARRVGRVPEQAVAVEPAARRLRRVRPRRRQLLGHQPVAGRRAADRRGLVQGRRVLLPPRHHDPRRRGT